MSIKRFMMPLDYTGELQSNRVSGEVHELAKTNFKLVVPYSGYFYTHNFKIYDEHSTPLDRGTHFEFVYANEEVQMRTAGLEVVGALILKPNVKSATVRIHYNQVGGPYANYTRAIEQALINLDLDGRTVDFASLVNIPEYFLAGPHVEDIGNVFGFEYMRLGLDRIRDTLERSGKTTSEQVAGLLGDLIDQINLMYEAHANDPKAHHTTANDVGAYSKEESDRMKAELAQSIEQVKASIDDLNAGSGALEEKVQACVVAVRQVSRRMTVIDNIAKNAIRRFGGGTVIGGGSGGEGGVSLGDVQKMIAALSDSIYDTLAASERRLGVVLTDDVEYSANANNLPLTIVYDSEAAVTLRGKWPDGYAFRIVADLGTNTQTKNCTLTATDMEFSFRGQTGKSVKLISEIREYLFIAKGGVWRVI